MTPILLHNTYAQDTEALFALAWKAGFNGVELVSPGFRQSLSEIAPGMEAIARLKDKYLCPQVILNFPMQLVGEDEWRGRDECFERMGKAFELAARHLGARRFNTSAGGAIIPPGNKYTQYHLNGSVAADDGHWERAISMVEAAAGLAREHGVDLVVESHGCLIHDTPRACARLLESVKRPNVKLNLDLANLVLTKTDMLSAEELAPLLPMTAHLHLKNLRFVLGGGFLLESVSRGEIQYEPLLGAMAKTSPGLTCSLEFPGRHGDLERSAHQDLRFVREMLLRVDRHQGA